MSTCVPKGSRSAKGAAAAEVEPRDVDLQPEVKWHDGAAGYVARLDLAGFRKEEFRVQVDGAGRVTMKGMGFNFKWQMGLNPGVEGQRGLGGRA
ncbi:hypothetical protein OsJ_02399 [Oryza sativa Japonica Group]|uniref:SHSP domain-containing protein n=1 Tax=Oryza sativa subsp. japonica TaxID=39947 RepID=B9EXS6_ORYSJ|nr:hypothetical protein OsJ_02399 [Oryza sativa Japonica Group]